MKLKNIVVEHLEIILFSISIICIIQIASGIFQISLLTVDNNVKSVFDDLAISWIGGYFFYLLVVYLPEKRNSYYSSIYLFRYINQSIRIWRDIKKSVLGKQSISKDDEDALEYIINKIDKKSLQYFYIKELEKYIEIILRKNNQFDSRLIHYIDVIQLNLMMFKFQFDLKFEFENQDEIANSYNIDSMILIDKYFSAIEKIWKKELKIANGKYEAPYIKPIEKQR